MFNFDNYYTATDPAIWTGRVDGVDLTGLRWHQVVSTLDLRRPRSIKGCYVLLGFPVDEGVQRNMGRTGAADAPALLRQTLGNIPLHDVDPAVLLDAGDICCPQHDLEGAQKALAQAVKMIVNQGGFPLLLGGGHEMTYGHYTGLRQTTNGRIGIVNFDAHFDLRPIPAGGSNSGTGFYEIARDEALRGEPIHYLALGIQRISNTKALFEAAAKLGVRWVEADDFHVANQTVINEMVDSFLDGIDVLYVTVDLDVFASPFAPGVSAPAYNGVLPDAFFRSIFTKLIRSEKLISVDIAELNPTYDIDGRTAKLAADLIAKVVCGSKTT
ncbi:MAG TPA: formimidoylglutamase [Sphingobacterium sp.]|nr:formimidoylglutamase [Sphingobacterium sp.]